MNDETVNHYFEHLQKSADTSIEVLSKLPEGSFRIYSWYGEETATEINAPAGLIRDYYYCKCCSGWIEGLPDSTYVNTIQPYRLSGRKGNAIKCRRCKWEISFNGFVS